MRIKFHLNKCGGTLKEDTGNKGRRQRIKKYEEF
jgi:hypothetical protein